VSWVVAGVLLLLASLGTSVVLLYRMLARNGRLLLRLEELRSSAGGQRATQPFRWRNRFELENVVAPIFAGNEYDLGDRRFTGPEVILDVGAHIGVFARFCHQRGGRAIHCYEPDANNFELLRNNVGRLPGVHLTRAAVWRSDGGAGADAVLSGADGDNTGAPSVLADGRVVDFGRQTVADSSAGARVVRTVPLDTVLSAHDRVDLLKLDCEGSEFPILLTSLQLHRVHRIVGEIHELTEAALERLSPASRVGGYREYSVDVLVECLQSHGFEVRTRQTSPHLFLFSARRPEADDLQRSTTKPIPSHPLGSSE
jgi:FkbM family methyltransferase